METMETGFSLTPFPGAGHLKWWFNRVLHSTPSRGLCPALAKLG